jgi:hypothetical protein
MAPPWSPRWIWKRALTTISVGVAMLANCGCISERP